MASFEKWLIALLFGLFIALIADSVSFRYQMEAIASRQCFQGEDL